MDKEITSKNQQDGITAETVNIEKKKNIPSTKKTKKKLSIVGIFSIAGVIIAILTYFGLKPNEKRMNNPGEKYPPNVTSYNQQGGITAGVVNITTIPEAELSLKQILVENELIGNLYKTEFLIQIDSKVPINNLYFEVHAPTIMNMDIVPQRVGPMISGHSGKREGFVFESLPNAYGTYKIIVTTKNKEKFNIIYNIE